jgi:hypothetical protein
VGPSPVMVYCKPRGEEIVSYLAVRAKSIENWALKESSGHIRVFGRVTLGSLLLQSEASHDLPAVLSWLSGARFLFDWR